MPEHDVHSKHRAVLVSPSWQCQQILRSYKLAELLNWIALHCTAVPNEVAGVHFLKQANSHTDKYLTKRSFQMSSNSECVQTAAAEWRLLRSHALRERVVLTGQSNLRS